MPDIVSAGHVAKRQSAAMCPTGWGLYQTPLKPTLHVSCLAVIIDFARSRVRRPPANPARIPVGPSGRQYYFVAALPALDREGGASRPR